MFSRPDEGLMHCGSWIRPFPVYWIILGSWTQQLGRSVSHQTELQSHELWAQTKWCSTDPNDWKSQDADIHTPLHTNVRGPRNEPTSTFWHLRNATNCDLGRSAEVAVCCQILFMWWCKIDPDIWLNINQTLYFQQVSWQMSRLQELNVWRYWTLKMASSLRWLFGLWKWNVQGQ